MTTHYDGRHRSQIPVGPAGHPRRHVPTGLVRRPLITLAAATALVGVSAVGYAKAGDIGAIFADFLARKLASNAQSPRTASR